VVVGSALTIIALALHVEMTLLMKVIDMHFFKVSGLGFVFSFKVQI